MKLFVSLYFILNSFLAFSQGHENSHSFEEIKSELMICPNPDNIQFKGDLAKEIFESSKQEGTLKRGVFGGKTQKIQKDIMLRCTKKIENYQTEDHKSQEVTYNCVINNRTEKIEKDNEEENDFYFFYE